MQNRNNDPSSRKPIRIQRCRNTANGDCEEIFVLLIDPQKRGESSLMSDFFSLFFLDDTKGLKIISISLRLRGGCNNNETSRTIRG